MTNPESADQTLDGEWPEVERGLRFAHIMLMVGQSQGNEALAGVMALADLLVANGVISEEEFGEYRARARAQVDQIAQPRVRLASLGDKYQDTEATEIDCAARIHLCQARCCTFNFYLTVQDLEEGVARWDYGNPYWIKHESDGYCTHCDPSTRACSIHSLRPHVCRLYDCRNDKRIWIDFEGGVPATMSAPTKPIPIAMAEPDLSKDLFPVRNRQTDV